jgi:hypothetical protein
MSAYLLSEATGRVVVIVAALGIASGAKALVSVLRIWIEQASRTRRFGKALEGSTPAQRPEIITACSQLEGVLVGKTGCDTTDGMLPAHRQAQATGAIPPGEPQPRSPRGLAIHEAARPVALSQDKLIRRLVKLVAELDLDRRDFVIFGSGPLLAHGLRRRIRDLDVVARGRVWRRVCQYGIPAIGEINGAPMALFCNGLIQFSRGWISEDWDPDDLIDRAEVIQGLPFAQLTDVLAYKQMLRRPKDLPDIEALLDLLRG